MLGLFGAGDKTQGFIHARQALHQVNQVLSQAVVFLTITSRVYL